MEIYIVKEDGRVPELIRGEYHRTIEKTYDNEDLARVFYEELLGYKKRILDDYDRRKQEQYKLLKTATTEKENKEIQKQIKNIESEKEKQKKILSEVKVKIGIIVELCSRYGLNIDGTLRKDSKYREVFTILEETADKKTKNDFWKLFASIQKQIKSEYKNLVTILLNSDMSKFNIYFINSSNEYSKISFAKLLETSVKYPTSLLDTIIEQRIEEKYRISDREPDEENEIHTSPILLERIEEIQYLKSSKKLKPNELEILNKIDFIIKQTISLNEKRAKIKKALLFLKKHSNFQSIIQQLEKQLKKLNEQYLELEHLSNELYEKFNVKQQIVLVNEMIENDKIQGESIYKMDVSRDDTSKWSTNRDILDNAKFQERTLNGRTLMAQYLREKAFKTKDGKLSWREFAEKYSKVYDVDSITISRLDQGDGTRSERKL